MIKTWHFALLAVVAWFFIAYIQITFEEYAYIYIIVTTLIFTFFFKSQENIKHISAGLVLVISFEFFLYSLITEILFPERPAYFVNALIFSLHFFTDLALFYYFKNRTKLSMAFISKFVPEKREFIYMTHADILLVGIYFLFMVVDIAAFIENLIRNMDYIFGVAEDTAKPFWSWNWVYQSYPYAKAILLAAVVTVLLATVYVERFRPAPIEEKEDSARFKEHESQGRS
ncbi:hypothetical protein [Pseudoalteromonas piscicida]|uniref:Uncharacterized protein n=1 Tax=Pseudoalteromonas piscicida TaxID=43662 RepID=A0A2A5JPP2_PSEO7|nr:hypothetical protein [Pseudoalteromonas piscicida]PCK31388.1 hypothetical protein CEX98_12120 [Pseudoalteromonas piscicida]